MKITIESLKGSKEFLNTVIDNIEEAIFLVDRNIRIYDVNEAGSILFKKKIKNFIDELFGNALECINTISHNKTCGHSPECANCRLRISIQSTFNEKKALFRERFEKEFNIKNIRQNKIFLYSTRFINFKNMELVLVIMEDITEIETQRIKLEKLNEEKNHLLGIAAHDLRSPISVIQMYSEFILDKLSSNLTKEQVKFIRQIYNTSFSMSNLLKDILDMARIDQGEISLLKKKEDYIYFVKDAIKLNKIIANKKDIRIEFKSEEKQLLFKFDKNKLSQVFNNLLTNAIKFSNSGTKVTVRVSMEKKTILTEIIDRGQGIPREESGKIFKPFQKTSVKPTAGESSTGLGLAIVKKIVEAHNGRINFSSEVGKGSCFYFYLPFE